MHNMYRRSQSVERVQLPFSFQRVNVSVEFRIGIIKVLKNKKGNRVIEKGQSW